MAKPKKVECKKGSPEWMTTFTDLVFLVLVFFVLMFSMATIEADRFMEFAAQFRRDGADTFLEMEGNRGMTEMLGNGIVEFPTPGTTDAVVQEREDILEEQLLRQQAAYQQALLNLFPSAFETYFDHMEGTPETWLVQLDVLEDFTVSITIGNEFLFAPGSATLTDDARRLMAGVAEIIEFAYLEGDNIIIAGHTDNVPHRGGGGFRDNRDLSFGRARSVMDELLRLTGFDGSAFELRAMGEYHPVDPLADNNLEENRQLNRRVEIFIQAGVHTDVFERFMGHGNNNGNDAGLPPYGYEEDEYGDSARPDEDENEGENEGELDILLELDEDALMEMFPGLFPEILQEDEYEEYENDNLDSPGT